MTTKTRKRSETDLWHPTPIRFVSFVLSWLQSRFCGAPALLGRSLEVRPETGGLGHATRSQREEDEVLSTFHLADETWHEKQ
jgi:hypothetical protein